ncbi:MAG: ABC transporter permease [Phycisphaerales bacterium]|jgi:putative ABC transport system permease protein|nr:ABC transporter permease [Phycisphaerales bacterium]
MSTPLRVTPVVLKQIRRSRIRSLLTISGIAVAMFLFCVVESMREGVQAATVATAEDTTLVVYRENRYCPFSSNLPQFYADRIKRIDGVDAVIPMQIMVNNCRASLDVVTYRGVPEDDLESALERGSSISDGSLSDWMRRGDGALVGEALATRRGVKVGDRFSAAGVTVFVAGILSSDAAQDRNVAYVHLPFLQESMRRGGTGGTVTQFNVKVEDPMTMESIASAIDAEFKHDEHPTSTRSEKAFVGRAARDIIEIVGFASWLGWGSLITVFALVANAIVLSMRDRIRDHAVLQTLGYSGALIGWMVLLEGAILGLIGGAIGTIAAWSFTWFGRFSMTMEGLNVEISSDPLVMALGIGLALALGILAGVVPAWRVSRREIAHSFRAV